MRFAPAAAAAPAPDATAAPAAAPTGDVPLPITAADLQAVTDAGLLVVQFTVQLDGSDAQILATANALQAADRLFLVHSVDIASGGEEAPPADADEEGGSDPDAGAGRSGTIRALAFVLPSLEMPEPTSEPTPAG
jgi:hypothetical protein